VRRLLALMFCGLFLVCASAEAGFVCSGILTGPQQQGFGAIFVPPYSPSLRHQGGNVEPANMAKEVTQAELTRLEVPKPLVAVEAKLSATQAKTLKSWLNANANEAVPSWTSTAIGILVPQAWVGVAADVFIQLINGAGSAGRQTAANLAGTVSQGGIVGVTERIAKEKTGARKFLWTYQYQAKLNDVLLVTPLTSCWADVVVK
jgi:hypothetical protein